MQLLTRGVEINRSTLFAAILFQVRAHAQFCRSLLDYFGRAKNKTSSQTRVHNEQQTKLRRKLNSRLQLPGWVRAAVGRMTLLTAEKLRSQTSKDLAQLAKKRGVQGWHSMRKEELVKALLLMARANTKSKSKAAKSKPAKRAANGRPQAARKSNPAVANRIRKERRKLESIRDVSTENREVDRDRIILIVRDSYWIQAYWEIAPSSIRRTQVALGPAWHHAKPVLRIYEVSDGDGPDAVDKINREIEIHGGVNNWYVDVRDHGCAYRAAIGYATESGKFHMIAKSNDVSVPLPASNDAFDINWADIADDFEKIYSQSCPPNAAGENSELKEVFEEKLRRPMATSLFAQFSGPHSSTHDLKFEVDAQMIIYGRTSSSAHVTLAGEPVKLEPDGTFAVRMPLPDRRQVLPIVAHSRDRCQQRTTILAVERNTKDLEPLSREPEQDFE